MHSTKDYRDFDGTAADAYVKTAYELNGAGMTTKITYTDYAGAVGVKKEEYTIGYDKRGYITSETAASNYDGEKTENRSYVYDDLGRLTSSTMGEKTHTYTYDKVGNRQTEYDGTKTMSYYYNEFDQLTQVTKGGAGYLEYTYDNRGNQKMQNNVADEVAQKYTYNLMDQLYDVRLWVGNYEMGDQQNYYNAGGQRVRMVDDGTITKYYYDKESLLYTTNGQNLMVSENILDENGRIITSKRFEQTSDTPYENKYYFYNYDIRGSVTNILN
ncbi:MAG: hypothetical protein RR777_07345, partial [Christensenellaceae bacterium]